MEYKQTKHTTWHSNERKVTIPDCLCNNCSCSPVSLMPVWFFSVSSAEGSLTENKLSGGAIAGIVIAVLVLVGLAVGLTVYFTGGCAIVCGVVKKKKKE